MTQTTTAYKLMSKTLTTYAGYQWVMGEWRKTSGKGWLCSAGWFHAYATPSIAMFHNAIHARMNLSESILVEVACRGDFRNDRGLKCGYTEMCPIREVPLIIPTLEQYVRYGIYCAAWVDKREEFLVWARDWLSGEDRSRKSARSAAVRAVAAAGAAASAAASAAEAAAWEAAARSARSAAARAAAWEAAAKAAAAARAASAAVNRKFSIDYPWEEFALAALNDAIPASLQSILSEETNRQ